MWVLADSAYNNIAIREYLRAGLEGVLYPKGFVRKGVHKINQWCGAYIVWYAEVDYKYQMVAMKAKILKIIFPVAVSMAVILFVTIVLIMYYPTLFNWPGNNVYIEDLEWKNVTKINDTTYRTTLSMNFTYLYKDAYSNRFSNDESTDEIPVIVQVKTDFPMHGHHPKEDYTLSYEEEINLQYLQRYPYECTFDLDSGKDYFVVVVVQWKKHFDSPHPRYGEWKFEDLGGLSTGINLSTLS